ncbi:MAG TPA: hypothetical protein VG672_25910 [Bryobacteraceae bacterium]|nr:hypothetical protein [Bryobacteraceae bacterium]
MRLLCAILLVLPAWAASFSAPAGIRPAVRRPGAASILPGGRVIAPLGKQHVVGPGPFGLAISSNGRTLVSADIGPIRYGLSVLESDKQGLWHVHHVAAPPRRQEREGQESKDAWTGVSMGLAFSGDKSVYVAEGNSGRVRLIDLGLGGTKKVYDLNQDDFSDSFTGDLAFDAERGMLYVLDQANFRMVTIDVRNGRVAASTRLGRLPFAITLSPDKHKAYVTNIGMFEYRAIKGADARNARESWLNFPAFGFPSVESAAGAQRATGRGTVEVPGLGEPHAREANSLCVIDLANPAAPKVVDYIPTGTRFGNGIDGGSSPSGVLAAADRVYVSNGHNDSITVIDAGTNKVIQTIPIRIPELENYRGVLPIGMAIDEQSGWLLVAEAGINAVGVIDTREGKVLGHLPVGWFPARVLVDRQNVYVANLKGVGIGPNLDPRAVPDVETFAGTMYRGTISMFPLPSPAELAKHTALVLEANGFRPRAEPPAPLPKEVRYVVLIVKENRAFNEVLGDIQRASNGPVVSLPQMAWFGRDGWADGRRKRLSLQHINVTPNHHAIAEGWSFSDNFYADSDTGVDGHHWLAGAYPDAWTETTLRAALGGEKDFRFPSQAPGRLMFGNSSAIHPEEQPEAGTIWHHLERNGITFRNFGGGLEVGGVQEGPAMGPTGARFVTNEPVPDALFQNTSRDYPVFNLNIPDQKRASTFIQEVEQRYIKGGEPFPRFLYVYLPNDYLAEPNAEAGYPYPSSFIADNDYALGRILELLSRTRWWREMAVFITEDNEQGGRDHIDAHRTLLLAAGPYCKRNYVSHVNTGFPGLLKTIFRLLGLSPLNLFDAAASDLSDCFTTTPDFGAYTLQPIDSRLFVPSEAKER